MALNAGTLSITIQFASALKDKDWVFRQDPFALLQCGSVTRRTRTARSGGTSPVWNETFTFEVLNENDVIITIKDNDVIHDDFLGRGNLSLRNVREWRQENQVVQLYSHNNEQRGQVNVMLQFQANNVDAYPSTPRMQPAYPGYPPQQIGAYPMPQPSPYPPQQQYGYTPQPSSRPGYDQQVAIDELRFEERELRRELREERREERFEEREREFYQPYPAYPPQPFYPQPLYAPDRVQEVVIVEERGW